MSTNAENRLDAASLIFAKDVEELFLRDFPGGACQRRAAIQVLARDLLGAVVSEAVDVLRRQRSIEERIFQ